MNEKFAIDYVEKYRINLKRYGDYIKEECTRFYQNETIAKKLEPIVEQITQASNKAKEEKERIRDEISAKKTLLNEENNANYDISAFDYNCLPEFPDLLSFYKSILDEIPLVFLTDLTHLKKFAKKYIETKKQSNIDQSLSTSSAFNNLNQFPIVSKPFCAPSIADLPKPDFSLFGAQETGFSIHLNSTENDNISSKSANQMSFPKRSSSPILTSLPSLDTLSHNIKVSPNASTPNSLVKQSNEKSISPIGQPLQTLSSNESKVIREEKSNHQNNESKLVINAQQIHSNSSNLGPKQSYSSQTTNVSLNQKSSQNTSSESSISKLSAAQIKLLAKLKEKYTDLSELVIILFFFTKFFLNSCYKYI
jgi:hypothetical protein